MRTKKTSHSFQSNIQLPTLSNAYSCTGTQKCFDGKTFKQTADPLHNIEKGPLVLNAQNYPSITSFVFTSCKWQSCKGGTGGGIYSTKSGSTLKVISCYFHDCYAENDFGGGIATEFLDNVYIYSSSFVACHGKQIPNTNSGGGAVFLNDTKQCHQIHDCDFIGCFCGADGGALHLRYSKVMQIDGIANARFVDCKSIYETFGVEGGALQSWTVTVTCSFSNSLITKCHSYVGGGFYFQVKDGYANNIILFCLFNDNTATDNGNDMGVSNFWATNGNFFKHSFSTSKSCRVYYYDTAWHNTDVNWLPLTDFAIKLLDPLVTPNEISSHNRTHDDTDAELFYFYPLDE